MAVNTAALRDYNDIFYGTLVDSTPGLVNANGVKFRREHFQFGTDHMFFYVPEVVQDGKKITYVQWSHGFSGTYKDLEGGYTQGTRFLSLAMDRGWVVSVGDDGGPSHWSKPIAMKVHRSHYAYAADRWNIERVLLAGGSMGGLTTLNLLGNDVIPKVAATAVIVSVVDLPAMTTTGYSDYVYPAWGVSNVPDLTAAIQGLDPARDDPQKWAGKPIWINAGTQDTLVPKVQHGDVFVARAATPEAIHYDVGNHGHGGPSSDAPWVEWLSTFAPNYDVTQNTTTDPGPPPPSGDGGTVPPAVPSGSGVYWADGREASLYRPDGTLVRLGRL